LRPQFFDSSPTINIVASEGIASTWLETQKRHRYVLQLAQLACELTLSVNAVSIP
jgi:hypothetical protein